MAAVPLELTGRHVLQSRLRVQENRLSPFIKFDQSMHSHRFMVFALTEQQLRAVMPKVSNR